jgi:ATP-dependent DNA ligase
MKLPLVPTLAPMEAETAVELPRGPEWQYEPKWDGFRALVFRDRNEIELNSKACNTLGRYFPELVHGLDRLAARRFFLDGEIVVPRAGSLSLDALRQRIHPTASRIRKLARETPATFVVFDLLVDGRGRTLSPRPGVPRQ